jgi:NAD(P) transhydrogenase subunit beta
MFIPSTVLSVAYLIAAVLFVMSLGGLSTQQTARKGNIYGMLGMLIAVVATAAQATLTGVGVQAGALVVGSVIGAVLAARVAMTAMPELVAILHSFVGLAAVLVGVSSHLHPGHPLVGAERAVHLVEIWLGVAIGALTFTGSIVAWAKLRGTVSGKPLLLPGRHLLNAVIVGSLVLGIGPYLAFDADLATGLLVGNVVIAGVLGVHLVMAIGGADMPVVVSLLNSYSGWAAAAAGFMLGNDLLIVTGALVGSSGAILSTIMCRAMNRSIWNVVFGGFGADSGAAAPAGAQAEGTITEMKVDEVAALARAAKEIVIVPGYGMAVARAQHSVNDFTRILRERGVNVRYAIHPVAGRLPGHMNVLLAEAGVPYDIVLEMEEINQDFAKTDLVLVIGANDIVNPGAETDPSSPIYGMPVLQVWNAKAVIVSKRGMSAGYAGVENPLFYHERAHMLFGDANKTMQALVGALREG